LTAEVVHDRNELLDTLEKLKGQVDDLRAGKLPGSLGRGWKMHLGWASQSLGRAGYYIRNHVRR